MNHDEGTPPPLPPYRPAPHEGPTDDTGADLTALERRRALESLEAKAAFRSHLTVYALVMLLLVGIWAVTSGPSGFFWPVFPMMGWGLGLAIHGASLRWDREPTEADIAAEMERLRRRRSGGALEQ